MLLHQIWTNTPWFRNPTKSPNCLHCKCGLVYLGSAKCWHRRNEWLPRSSTCIPLHLAQKGRYFKGHCSLKWPRMSKLTFESSSTTYITNVSVFLPLKPPIAKCWHKCLRSGGERWDIDLVSSTEVKHWHPLPIISAKWSNKRNYQVPRNAHFVYSQQPSRSFTSFHTIQKVSLFTIPTSSSAVRPPLSSSGQVSSAQLPP